MSKPERFVIGSGAARRGRMRRLRWAIAARLVDFLFARVLPQPAFRGGWDCWTCLRSGWRCCRREGAPGHRGAPLDEPEGHDPADPLQT